MKRTFFLFLSFVCGLALEASAQSDPPLKTIYNEEFKWTISIPQGFDTVGVAEWTKLQNRGSETIEKTYDAKVENNARTLFVFRSGQVNYFEANVQPNDAATDEEYKESFREVNQLLYGVFEAQMEGATLDSASSVETISGLSFQVFKVKITLPNKLVLNWRMYSRQFGQKEFTINIMAIDKVKEQEMLKSWLESRFDK